MNAIPTPAGREHYIGISIVALVCVAYQVLLTRIFSVMLYYHFAFAGISLAMLGLTIGAQKVHLNPLRFAPEHFEEEWVKAALRFSLSSVALVLCFLAAPEFARDPWILLSYLLLFFVIPFTASGICVTLVLTQATPIGALYAADLTGAAIGCVSIVMLLAMMDPISILFLLAALVAYAAWRMARFHHKELARKALRIFALMLLACIVQATLARDGFSHLGVIWAKNNWQVSPLFERWNAFSRVRVIPAADDTPFGWGFGHSPQGKIEQRYLDIDAGAGTVLTRFDGDRRPLSYLGDDIINMGYFIRPVHSVAVIGVGAGRDVLSALYFNARKIIGIELNPAIIEVLTRTFADFTGHLEHQPGVTLVNAEARSWLGRNHPPVDLVQISLIDTWAATYAGGLALSENRLYTVEAWTQFLNTLTPGGMLVVSRWFDRVNYKGEFYRLLSLAAKALETRGVPRAEVRSHLLAFAVNRVVTVVVSPSVFSAEEIANARDVARKKGFEVVMTPESAFDETSRIIASGEADEAFYARQKENLDAPVDDKPFFFFITRVSDALKIKSILDLDVGGHEAIYTLFILLAGTFIISLFFIFYPLIRKSAIRPSSQMLPSLFYFACIGLAFMLIEISQIQRLMVFLGNPVYGLSVVLFTLLLFGGLGSYTVSRESSALWKRPLGLCIVLCITGLLTPYAVVLCIPSDTITRIAASIGLLAPAGFFMGMMLPTGMFLSSRFRSLQPWFWGVNGAMSVFGSVLGMIISVQWGISDAYWSGVFIYALCLALTAWRKAQVI